MAANPERGETDVVIGGKTYTLVMTFNSLIKLQKLCSAGGPTLPIEQILRRADEGDLETFRAVFWATLQRHHPSITVEEAGELVAEAGGLGALNRMLDEVQAASAPDTRDVEALGGGQARPPRATGLRRRRAGSGAPSTSEAVPPA